MHSASLTLAPQSLVTIVTRPPISHAQYTASAKSARRPLDRAHTRTHAHARAMHAACAAPRAARVRTYARTYVYTAVSTWTFIG